MILLGFWHCYFKSVSLHFPSQAPGQRRITCTLPSCKSPHCRLFEDDQRVLWDEPMSPAQPSTELHAYSPFCFEQAQGNTAHVTIDASGCSDERRPRREVTARSYSRSLWQEESVLLASFMQFTLPRLPSAQLISTRESKHSYKQVSPKLLLVSLVIQQTQVE